MLPCIYDLSCPLDIPLMNKIIKAHRTLGELTGISKIIPNELILLRTLPLQEAQGSSEIENIITTTQDIFQTDEKLLNPSAKEVKNYGQAIMFGFEYLQKLDYIDNKLIKKLQELFIHNNAGFRKIPGTFLKNNEGKVVYTPPQDYNEILPLMEELEKYINDNTLETDPLIKMALIHYQFESIHPFYDGNGRTGRIINILYLIKEGLIDTPILYLSRYIIKHKIMYYTLLQEMRTGNDFYKWVDFILDCIIATANDTIVSIKKINSLLQKDNAAVKTLKISRRRDLIDHIFIFPITTRNVLAKELKISYLTAGKYLKQLADIGILKEEAYKGILLYQNRNLFNLLSSNML